MGWDHRISREETAKTKAKSWGRSSTVSHLLIQQILRECLECQRTGQTWAYLNEASSLEGEIGHELVNNQPDGGVCSPSG